MEQLLLALRYLVSRPISIVSMMGVLVGLGALVLVDSVMNGFLREQQAIIRGTLADLAVTLPADVCEKPTRVEELLETVRAEEGVAAATLRMEVPCVFGKVGQSNVTLGTGQWGAGHFLTLVGIDPEDERQVTHLEEILTDPRIRYAGGFGMDHVLPKEHEAEPFWFDPDHPFWQERLDPRYRYAPLIPLRVGAHQASKMELKLGQVLTLATWSPADDEGIRQARTRDFVVCGTFLSKDMEFDLTKAFVPRTHLREFAGLASVGSEVMIRAAPGQSEDALRERLRVSLAAFGVDPAEVETWADRKAALLRAVENERRALVIVLFLMIVVAAFNLLVTLSMMVSDKVRDIGILTALGSSPGGIARLFLTCGLLVTVFGGVLGLVLGLALTHNINEFLGFLGVDLFNHNYYVFQTIPTEVDPTRIAVFVAATFACTILFTSFPALRAARLDSVEALRHG